MGFAAGCGHQAPRQNVEIPAPAPEPGAQSASQDTPEALHAPKKTVIYTVGDRGGDDNDLVAHPVSLRHSQSPARDALQALIDVPSSPIPTGTKLLGLKIVDGLATVDLYSEFQSNFHGSDTQEAQTVNSVLRTLGQFPTIDRVQFLMEGKPIDALSQLPLSGPLDVIRPASTRTADTGGNGAHG